MILYVALRIGLRRLVDAEARDERGQGTLEYVGMVAVAAVLVVAVLTVTGQVDLGKFFSDQLKKVTEFGG